MESNKIFVVILALLVISVNGQISTPCTASMISSFTPCINFITGSTNNGSTPSSSCCNSLKSLMDTSRDCACLLITASVSFQLPINPTLGISLPRACNMSGVPLQCKATGSPLPAPVFVMCIVVVAAMQLRQAEATDGDSKFKDCFTSCEKECMDDGHGNTFCEMKIYPVRAKVKKHIKQGEGHEGGIFTVEAPIHVSNIQVVDPVTGKPCKVGIRYLEDGTKVRISRGIGASGSIIPRPEILKIRTTPRPTAAGPKDTPMDLVLERTHDAKSGKGMPNL
ncbi:50S ribosomal protein L24 [Tripterygium wilfordii]|uniref:50S ribosomal protein L24 n=1 Tax=Tripterygium wilfordii TaxID=458696 RepID=A0A7J7D6G5_TRIWF|nr:50S ribosomal protein L24 [Tripterygium wilfordii]